MKRTKTKILSVFLSFCMIVSCMVGMSITASAETKNIAMDTIYYPGDVIAFPISAYVKRGEYTNNIGVGYWTVQDSFVYISDFSTWRFEIEKNDSGWDIPCSNIDTNTAAPTGVKCNGGDDTQGNPYTFVTYREVTEYPLWIGTTRVTSANAADTEGTRGWSYTPATEGDEPTPAILTLNNFTYSGEGYNNAAIYTNQNLTIDVTGTNTITHTATDNDSHGISVTGIHNLTITGDGTLTVNSSNTSSSLSEGIYVGNLLTIDPDATVIANGGKSTHELGKSFGVCAEYGLHVDGTLEAYTDPETNIGYGIYEIANNFIIGTTGNVTVAGKNKAIFDKVKNSVPGTGWDNTAGTGDGTAIGTSTDGQALTYKKVVFEAEEEPDYPPYVISPEGAGTVAVTGSAEDGFTYTATANDGYLFVKWTIVPKAGDSQDVTNNPYTLPAATVSGVDHLEAVFESATTVSFSKVTSADQITAANIGVCTFDDAKGWILTNWDALHEGVAEGHYANFAYTVGNGLNYISFAGGTGYSKDEWAAAWTQGYNVNIEELTDWFNGSDTIYLCDSNLPNFVRAESADDLEAGLANMGTCTKDEAKAWVAAHADDLKDVLATQQETKPYAALWIVYSNNQNNVLTIYSTGPDNIPDNMSETSVSVGTLKSGITEWSDAVYYIPGEDSFVVTYQPGDHATGTAFEDEAEEAVYNLRSTVPEGWTVDDGYELYGWTVGETLYGLNAQLELTDNITATAVWQKKSTPKPTPVNCTVTFDTDGGTPEPDPISKTIGYGEKISKPETDPEKEGYSFMFWSENGRTEYDFSSPVISDTTLKAIYSANKYTITFDSDGGRAVAPITQDYGTVVTKPYDPIKTGYTFDGWEPALPATMPAEDMTVTAKWKVNKYTITFITGDGTQIAPITQDFGTAVTVPADPTRDGYAFLGWDRLIPATMPAWNMTINALWADTQPHPMIPEYSAPVTTTTT
ncbi:MAG: InlB B-repeat-containing protein, partial [Ruminiclostridium sp.]|nr:InlB B-repeat-containing protein [Ruminiclostridium sp.]